MGSAFCIRLLKAASIAATLVVALMALTTLPADAASNAAVNVADNAADNAANADAVVEVSIINMQFVPQKIKIKPGTKVKWLNKEKRSNHSVFFEKEGLPESDRLFPDESWQRQFDKPGVYPYICGPHPHMTGEVIVAD
jgi:plastocyanin